MKSKSNLLETNDFIVEIIPQRQTDAYHLRNGFVRMITQHYNEEAEGMGEDEREEFIRALADFKAIFPPKLQIKKDEVLNIKKIGTELSCSFKDRILGKW